MLPCKKPAFVASACYLVRKGLSHTEFEYCERPTNAVYVIVQTQGRNIRNYAEYLHQRAKSYGQTKLDYVRTGEGRLKKLSVEKGLLRETEIVQDQIRALIRCDVWMEPRGWLQ